MDAQNYVKNPSDATGYLCTGSTTFGQITTVPVKSELNVVTLLQPTSEKPVTKKPEWKIDKEIKKELEDSATQNIEEFQTQDIDFSDDFSEDIPPSKTCPLKTTPPKPVDVKYENEISLSNNITDVAEEIKLELEDSATQNREEFQNQDIDFSDNFSEDIPPPKTTPPKLIDIKNENNEISLSNNITNVVEEFLSDDFEIFPTVKKESPEELQSLSSNWSEQIGQNATASSVQSDGTLPLNTIAFYGLHTSVKSEQTDSSNSDFSAHKRKKLPFSTTEKTMIWNMYQSMRNAKPSASCNDISKAIASSVGIHWASVFKIVKEKNNDGIFKSPKKTKMRMKIVDIVDDFTKCAIRRIVHNFFSHCEIPTLDKILKKIRDDGTLGTFKRSTLHKILKNIGFKNKQGRNRLLVDRDHIFFWRRNYLRAIKHARENRQKIYYLDETCVNGGKGKRLIIIHIGSEHGFVDGGLHVFESKNADYHSEMNTKAFENWFEVILDKLDDYCVIVMDNASYHSRKTEKIPTELNKKQEIIEWLKEKNISFDEDLLKRELLNIVKQHKQRFEAHVVDEMAKAKNKTVLRLPPYHCELNPIELIWAQVKGVVASENTTYKMAELRKLLNNAIQNINAQRWQNCIKYVEEIVEPKMNAMDRNVEIMTDNLIINVEKDSSDTSSDSD